MSRRRRSGDMRLRAEDRRKAGRTGVLRDRIRVAVRTLHLAGVEVDPGIVARAAGGDLHGNPQHVAALIEAARDEAPDRRR